MSRHDADPLDVILAIRVVRLQAVVQGVAAGMMTGFAIFLATQWILLRGGPVVSPHLALLGQFLPGYTVSMAGSFVGFGWGFAYGFAGGHLVSTLYNRIVAARDVGGDRSGCERQSRARHAATAQRHDHGAPGRGT